MTYDALRGGRVSIPGQVYFVTMVTAGRRTLFTDFGLARVVIREMRRLDDDGWVESMAWVVMPDHVHWLIQLGREVSLARAMQAFNLETVVGRACWCVWAGVWREATTRQAHACKAERQRQAPAQTC